MAVICLIDQKVVKNNYVCRTQMQGSFDST